MSRFSLTVTITCLLAYVILAMINPLFDGLNIRVRNWVNRTRRPQIRPIMIWTHQYHDVLSLSVQLIVLSLLIGLVFRDWFRATVLTSAMFIMITVVGISKRLTSVDRPPQIAAHVFMTSGSYPSGHSAASLSFALLVPALLRSYLPLPVVAAISSFLILVALATAYGRLYLDVHWLTDIFGGWLLAIATYLLSRLLI